MHLIKNIYLVTALILCTVTAIGQNDSTQVEEDQSWQKQLTEQLKKDTTFALDNGLVFSTEKPDTSIVEEEVYLGLIGRSYKDSIVLRWAPSTRAAWMRGNEVGYVLVRIEMDGDTSREAYKEIAGLDNPIKPYDSITWSKYLPMEQDPYAMVAVAATMGELEVIQNGPYGFLDKAKEDNSTFGFALIAADHSQLAANGLALRYVDKDVNPNTKYIYAAMIADTTFGCYAPPLEMTYTGEAEKVEIVGGKAIPGDLGIELSWPKALNQGFTSYHILRTDDGGATYDTITKAPFVPGSDVRLGQVDDEFVKFYDTIAENYVPYRYRIVGNTPFADQSEELILSSMGKDLNPPSNPVIHYGKVLANGQIQVTWEEDDDTEPDFSHFNILHSNELNGVYSIVNENPVPAEDTMYVFKPSEETYISNYFKVEAVDTAGNTSRSFGVFVDIIDSIPPAIPVGLSGTVDSTGTVRLIWTANAEKDLDGYRVYFANNPKREFTQLTSSPVSFPQYVHEISLKNLSESIYYKIQATDRRHNHSAFTSVLEVKKPDLIPPVSPVMHMPKATEQSILLTWEVSSSKDVVTHEIWKKKVGEDNYQKLASLAKQEYSFEDEVAIPGAVYEYVMVAIDDAGLSSEKSFPVKGRVIDRKIKPMISDLKVVGSKEGAKIQWDYNEEGDYRFVIYKAKKGEPLRTYKSVDGKKTSIEDKFFPEQGEYEYAVKVLYKGGYKSKLSESVDFKYSKD